MDLLTGLRVLRERWISIAIIAVLTTLLGALITWQQTPRYEAQVTLYVSSWSTTSDASAAYTGSLASAARAKSYTELIRSDRVVKAVKDQLKLDLAPDVLASMITATVIPDTVLITVSVVDTSPPRALAIANALGDEFVKLVPDLEASPDGKTQAVRVSVVGPAKLPVSPVSPQPARNLGLAVLLGMLGGCAFAAARHTLDTSVKSTDQLVELAQAPTLGAVPVDSNSAKNPLIINDGPYSSRAEAFRKIRTNLQFVDVDRAHKVLLVTSAVAGEGKTSTACNLAITIAESGKRVLLIDADLRRPRAAKYLGLPNGVGLTSVLVGAASLVEAIQPWGDLMAVLSSGPIPPNPSELLGSRHMQALLRDLREQYDLVIIDGPPVLPVADAAATAGACDGVVLVVRHGRTRREQVQGTVTTLRTVDVPILGAVLNMVPHSAAGYYYYYNSEYGPQPGKDIPAKDTQRKDAPRKSRRTQPQSVSGPDRWARL